MTPVDPSLFPVSPFPLEAPVFKGKSRRVSWANLWEWFEQGWAVFVAAPRFWLGLTAGTALPLILFGLIWHPLLGGGIWMLLMPFVSVGFLNVCETLSNDHSPKFSGVLVGFRRCPRPLWVLGLFSVVCFVGFFILAISLGESLFYFAANSKSFREISVAFVGLGLLIPLSILALWVPLFIALWFAPALVFFNHATPFEAIKASFNACRKNSWVILAYGLLLSALFFFALLPVGLGLLVAIPVFVGSAYASYRDIFLAN